MKKTRLLMCLMAAMGIVAGNVQAEKVKRLLFLQDDAQKNMVSKIYELKHVMAGDIIPWVEGAVRRYSPNSKAGRLNYSAGKKQFLVVSTPSDMMKYVDALIETLDQPCDVKDASGSVISGTGIYNRSYLPKFRYGLKLQSLLNNYAGSSDGAVYFDTNSNQLYWKDSLSDGKTVQQWAEKLDHPVPQVELELQVYEIRTSVLNDIGLDYLAWKNGPGLDILSVGLEDIMLQSIEKAIGNIDMFSSFSYGGLFVAPQFDMSFVRLLSQKGDAKIAANGSLTLVHNDAGTYSVNLKPQMQNLEKDANDKTSVKQGASNTYSLTIKNPVICFHKTGQVDQTFEGNAFDYDTYSRTGGTVQFHYDVTNNNVVERNNRGDELTDSSTIKSNLTVKLDSERLLAVYTLNQKVEQTIGVPFLSDVPILKYLFSTTTSIDEEAKIFVTVKARLIHPEDNFSAWSGKLVSLEDFGTDSK